ncbi:hypothetical protein SCHAM137S_01168 [Streptomyces chartreusis]
MDNRPSRHRLVRIRSSRCEPSRERRLPLREIGGVLVRIGLIAEGGYPYVSGDARLWCDRLVRGLDRHEFDIYALSRSERQEDEGWVPLPAQVSRVRTAPMWSAEDDGVVYGRRARRRFAEHYGELAAVLCAGGGAGADDASGDPSATEADRFGSALYGLAELARDEGGLVGALRSEAAVRALEHSCRSRGALRTAREARVPDLLAVAAHLERALRPLSLDWYEDDGLGAVDLCHATSGGSAALPGLLARHFFGVPLLLTEYGVRLRTHYLAAPDSSPAVRSLLAAFHGALAAETYARAALVTPGNGHARRWQERCGADRAKLRTVYPGMDAGRFAEVGESAACADPDSLVWVGRVEPAKDLVSLLHAFAEVRKEEPKTRLRIVGTPAGRGRRLPRPLPGAGRATLPRRGGGAAPGRRQPRLLRGDRRPGHPEPGRRVRLRRGDRPVQRRRGLPHRPGRGHVLRSRDGVHGRRRGGGGDRRHRARRTAAQSAGARGGVRGVVAGPRAP